MPARSIVTEIWGEEQFDDLPSLAKLLFVRLVTGDDTGAAGATRTRPKRLAGDLGGSDEEITPAAVEEALAELQMAELIRLYEDGWIWIPKFIAHQAHSKFFLRAALRQTAQMPDSLARAVRRTVAKKATEHGWAVDDIRTGDAATSRAKADPRTKPRGKGRPKGSDKPRPQGSRARGPARRQGQDPSPTGLGSRGRPVEKGEPPADPDGPAAQAGSNGAGPGRAELRACKACDGPHLGPGSICDTCLESDEVRV